MLSDRERLEYLEKGYLVIRSFIKEPYISALQREADHLVNCSEDDISLDLGCIIQPIPSTKTSELNNSGRYGIERAKVSDEAPIILDLLGNNLPCVASLLIPESPRMLLFNEQYIIKTPGMGNLTEFPWHRDGDFIPSITTSRPFISCWICLSDTNKYNGALEVIPYPEEGLKDGQRASMEAFTSFRKYIDWHCKASGMSSRPKSAINYQRKLPIYTKAGDIVFMSPMLLHRSNPNMTNKFRYAYMPQFSSDPILDRDDNPISLTVPASSLSKLNYRT